MFNPSSSSSSTKNPKHLSIPTSSSASTQSPTTQTDLDTPVDPRSAAVAHFSTRTQATPSVDAALAKDEQALHNLSAADLDSNENKPGSSKMGNVTEQNAMDQVLSGILSMQKEVSSSLLRLEHRVAQVVARIQYSQSTDSILGIASSPACTFAWTTLNRKTKPSPVGTPSTLP